MLSLLLWRRLCRSTGERIGMNAPLHWTRCTVLLVGTWIHWTFRTIRSPWCKSTTVIVHFFIVDHICLYFRMLAMESVLTNTRCLQLTMDHSVNYCISSEYRSLWIMSLIHFSPGLDLWSPETWSVIYFTPGHFGFCLAVSFWVCTKLDMYRTSADLHTRALGSRLLKAHTINLEVFAMISFLNCNLKSDSQKSFRARLASKWLKWMDVSI